ncbi:MAG: DUF3800 domain-containing protein [Terriglobales bacterium]
MFSVYIDDSGSAPDHKFALAAGIVFPAKRIEPFEREWNNFLKNEGVRELHASVCVAHNPHSDFADWDDDRSERVLLHAQQIIFKYSVKAFSIGIHKQDYNELVPKEMWLSVSQSHYIWALSSVLGLSYDWASERATPMEYVFDNASKEEKRDIEEAIDYSEAIYPSHFSGHYSFRSRKEVPGLQAADLYAWVNYQAACDTRLGIPIKPIAEKLWFPFILRNQKKWSTIQSLNRKGLEMWVQRTYGSSEDLRLREYKQRRKEARMPKRKKGRTSAE